MLLRVCNIISDTLNGSRGPKTTFKARFKSPSQQCFLHSGRGLSRGDEGGVPGAREAAGDRGPSIRPKWAGLGSRSVRGLWMGQMYSSVSQYVRGISACSGLLVGARCLGGLF